MKIEQCNDAFVYTVSPDTVAKLYKQRLRWIHGFIKNTYDYRSILFQKKYGTFSIFTVPSGIISVVSATFLFMYSTYHFFQALYIKALSLWTVGFQPSNFRFHFNFDWFFISASLPKFLLFVLYTLLVVAIVIGHKMVERKFRLTWNIIPFMVIYSVLAPFWLLNAMYKAVVGGGVKWR